MRIGKNPEKDNNVLELTSYHRVIIPIYIPNLEEDYFKDGLKIFKYCIDSLLQTIHSKTRITLINNASCKPVIDFLEKYYKEYIAIDQLFHSEVNLGKINAVYTAVKGNLEPLITISDADVLFTPGWQESVENVFEKFPKAGMVSPVPSSIAYKSSFVNATFYYGFTRRKLKFKDVLNPKGLVMFQESIGRKLYDDIHLKRYLTLTGRDGVDAVIGCGHFVATLRATAFEAAPPYPTQFKIVGGSEKNYIDKPNDDAGYLRLATLENYAYHLGNKEEEWMNAYYDEVMAHEPNKNKINDKLNFNVRGFSASKRFIGKVLYKIFIRTNIVKRFYFNLLGMKDKSY